MSKNVSHDLSMYESSQSFPGQLTGQQSRSLRRCIDISRHAIESNQSHPPLKSDPIDLTLDDAEKEEGSHTVQGNSLKRKAGRKVEQAQDDRPQPSGSKRSKQDDLVLDEVIVTSEKIDLTIDDAYDAETPTDVDSILSDDEVQITGVRKCPKERRKPKLRQVQDHSRSTINQVMIDGVHVETGCSIEFQDGTFMRIRNIYPEKNHEFVLVGSMFTRVETNILMPRQRDSVHGWVRSAADISKLPRYVKGVELVNEVCQRIKTAAGEADHDEGLWRRLARDIKRRRDLTITNKSYEENAITEQDIVEGGWDKVTIRNEGPLKCRWKETITTDEYGKVREHKLHRPTNEELSLNDLSTATSLRKVWRGLTLNLAASKTKPTMAEGFCGAGGMTSGAQEAGYDARIAFDKDEAKIATHKLNFPGCKSMCMNVSDWITWAETQRLKVDVLHLSPPCQPYSPANTTPNLVKNEINQAVLLSCGQVVKRLRPRIVTVEESEGLLNRHSEWFGALLQQFTELGFSIRWACLKCSDFGVPQLRKRVFLIASAPGEDLPPFPEPTHAPGAVSIQTMLNDVEIAHAISPLLHHDPEAQPRIAKPPYDANTLAKTVTCKGGDNNYHPSGERPFTIREFMALQTFLHGFGFPESFLGRPFTTTEMKVQIGNAVPRLMGRAIMRSVLKSLVATDQRRLRLFGGAEEANAIEL